MAKVKWIVALNGSVFLLMFGVGMIVALLPQKVLTISGSVTLVGGLASAFAVSYILAQIPLGKLADRFGTQWFLTAGYFICAIVGLVYYQAETAAAMMIGRMIQGLGEAPLWALAPALLSVLYPSNKARAMGWYNASIHLGLTAGSLAGVLVSAVWTGSEPFLLFAGVSAMGGIWTLLALRDTGGAVSGAGPGGASADIGRLLKNRTVLFVCAGIMLYGLGYGIFLTVIPAFLLMHKGAGASAVGLSFVVFYVAISLAQIIAGPIADRAGRVMPMISGLAVMAFGMMVFPCLPLVYALAALFLAAFGLGVFLVASLAFLNDQVDVHLRGTISGAYYLFWGVGYFFGPMVMGIIGDAGHDKMGFLVLGVLYAVIAGMLGLANRRTSAAKSF